MHTPQSHKLSDKFHVCHSESAIDHRGDSQSAHLKNYYVFFQGAHLKIKRCFNQSLANSCTDTNIAIIHRTWHPRNWINKTNPVGRKSQQPPWGNYCHLGDAAAKINTQKWGGRRDPKWMTSPLTDGQAGETEEMRVGAHVTHLMSWQTGCMICLYQAPRLLRMGGIFIRMQRRLWHHRQNKRQRSCIGIDRVGLNRGAEELMAGVWAHQQELCCLQKCQVSTDNLSVLFHIVFLFFFFFLFKQIGIFPLL